MKKQILLSAISFVLATSAFAKVPDACNKILDQVLSDNEMGTRKNLGECVQITSNDGMGTDSESVYRMGTAKVYLNAYKDSKKGQPPYRISALSRSPLKGAGHGLQMFLNLDSDCNIQKLTYNTLYGPILDVTPATCKGMASTIVAIDEATAKLGKADKKTAEKDKHNLVATVEAADKKFGRMQILMCRNLNSYNDARNAVAGESATGAKVDYDSPAMNMGEAK